MTTKIKLGEKVMVSDPAYSIPTTKMEVSIDIYADRLNDMLRSSGRMFFEEIGIKFNEIQKLPFDETFPIGIGMGFWRRNNTLHRDIEFFPTHIRFNGSGYKGVVYCELMGSFDLKNGKMGTPDKVILIKQVGTHSWEKINLVN